MIRATSSRQAILFAEVQLIERIHIVNSVYSQLSDVYIYHCVAKRL